MSIPTSIKVAGIGALAAGALGVGVSAAGAAESPTPSPSASSSTTTTAAPEAGNRWQKGGQPGEGIGGHGKGGHGMRGPDTAALATKLGVSEDKLTSALSAVRQDMHAQKDATPGSPPSAAERAAREKAFASALAKELGIAESKVTKALDELQAERKADRRAELSTRLDEAVKAGTVTAADKASILKAFDAGVLGMGGRA